MADNTTLQSATLASPPAGLIVATDQIGGVDHQRVKIEFGADGTATDVSAADPLPVTAASLPLPSGAASSANQATVIGHLDGVETLLGTIDADTGSIATSAATLAGAVNGTEMQVDVASVAGTATNGAGQTTVTNSSTSIIASRAGRRGVLLTNYQTVAVYLDPSGGTATTSMFRLDPGASIVLPVTSAITGITSAAYSASGDAKVHYAELY